MRVAIRELTSGVSAEQTDKNDETIPVTRIEAVGDGFIHREKLGSLDPSSVPDRFLCHAGDIIYSNINSIPMIGRCAQVSEEDLPVAVGMNTLRFRPNLNRFDQRFFFWALYSDYMRAQARAWAKPAINQASLPQSSIKALKIPMPPLVDQQNIAALLDRETAEIDAFIADQEQLIELLEERRAATIAHAVTKGLDPNAPMKDSGINWLGAVPSHWEVNKIGRISEFTVGWTPPTGTQENFEGDNKWANISDLGPRTIYDTAKRVSDHAVETSRLKVSPRGSLLFGFKLSVGDVSFAGTEMYTNEAIATFFESKRVTLQYAYYAYPLFIIENAGENIYGARILNQERIRNAKIAFPPIEEQRVIADFLNHETSEIDAAVSDAREAIALSKERRAALISAAVTGQLDVSQAQSRGSVGEVLEEEVRV